MATCPYPCLFNLIWWHHASGWEQLTHATNPTMICGQSLHFFTIWMYKHCFLPLLLVSAMKCCVKMYCYLSHNPYCCSLPSPVCLLHLLICTWNQLFTHCFPTITCVMLMSCVFYLIFSSVLYYCFFFFCFLPLVLWVILLLAYWCTFPWSSWCFLGRKKGLENKQPCHFLLNPILHTFSFTVQVYFNLQQHGQIVNTFSPCLLFLLSCSVR